MTNHHHDVAPLKTVRVSAPARLHLGFLDLNGKSGRKFGSIGVAISTFKTTIEAHVAENISIVGIEASSQQCKKILSLVERFYNTLGKSIPENKRGVKLDVQASIPQHAGFGSGTQLALTVGKILSQLYGFDYSAQEIAAQLGRGKRSGIGIASFENGQFIVDGGLGPDTAVPPVLFQQEFPTEWRIVLIMPAMAEGVHGQQEAIAFETLPAFPPESVQTICQLTLMQLLPALLEEDIDRFGKAITHIQALIGDHFSPTQGGRYSSSVVAELIEKIQQHGYTGIAQSSWGPTACVFVNSDTKAKELVILLNNLAVSLFGQDHSLTFIVAQANQCGATIEIKTI